MSVTATPNAPDPTPGDASLCNSASGILIPGNPTAARPVPGHSRVRARNAGTASGIQPIGTTEGTA
jgi:hypothetical protein